MRKIALVAIAAAAAIAVPAQANEGRVEARGGIAWAGGAEEALAGVAAGYDWDLGSTEDGGAFVGIEGSADKILAGGTDIVWGATARIGANVGNGGKLYLAGGYSFGDGEDVPHLGAGYQHKVGENVYLKAEYRRFFSDFIDINTAAIGVGMSF